MDLMHVSHVDLEELCRRLLGYWQMYDNSLLLTVFDHFVETTTDKVPELDESIRRLGKPIEILATRPNLDAIRLNRTSFFHGIDINPELASRIYWLARSVDIDILVGAFMRVVRMFADERGLTHLRYRDKLMPIEKFTMRMIQYDPKTIHLMRFQYPDYNCNMEKLLEHCDFSSQSPFKGTHFFLVYEEEQLAFDFTGFFCDFERSEKTLVLVKPLLEYYMSFGSPNMRTITYEFFAHYYLINHQIQLLMTLERIIVSVVGSWFNIVCGWCGYPNQIKPCTGCKRVCYCDKVCQRLDWKFHKRQCRLYSKQNAEKPDGFQFSLDQLNNNNNNSTRDIVASAFKDVMRIGGEEMGIFFYPMEDGAEGCKKLRELMG